MFSRSRYFRFAQITCLTFFLAGCAGINQNFATFEPDEKAKIAFNTAQVNPDYIYYISGSDVYPVAILALDKSYTIGNDLLKEMPFTENSLRQTVDNMHQRILECCGQSLFGFAIYDPHGKQIGILYTYIGLGIALKVEENHVVKMYGPIDDDQLKSYQGRTSDR